MANSDHKTKGKKLGRRRYKTVTFKLSQGQYRSLMNYCKARKITPIKLVKRNISRFITAYEYTVPPELYVTENQLFLFEEDSEEMKKE